MCVLDPQSNCIIVSFAPVAQLDRVSGFEPGGREFESLRARHFISQPQDGQILERKPSLIPHP